MINSEFLNSSIYRNFKMISDIPRNSFQEKQISDFLLKWAKDRNLEVYQDKNLNIFVRKPATLGYENRAGVLLQAHIDMVCQKSPESNHDFSKDPIEFYIDGDIMSTRGQTTLGADNGLGVAYMLSVLESDSIPHPPLEALFTTAEEEDLSGALNFDGSMITASYLINLDNGKENQVLCGSCGGKGVKMSLPANKTKIDKSLYKGFKVTVEGMRGGHSGGDINKGHGNAIIAIGRILHRLKSFDINLLEVKGGTFRLALPREAEATVAVTLDKIDAIKSLIKQMEADIKNEYGNTSETLNINLQEVELTEDSCYSKQTFNNLLIALHLSPNGIYEMSNKIFGLVDASDNLGELYIKDDEIVFVYEIRSSLNSKLEYIYDKILLLAEIVGAKVEFFAQYPGWDVRTESKLRQVALKVYSEMFNEEPIVNAVHAGLECGCLIGKKSDLDAISIGSNSWGAHSPYEKASVSSFVKVWEYLKRILLDIE